MDFSRSKPIDALSYRKQAVDYRNDTIYGLMVTISWRGVFWGYTSGSRQFGNAYVDGRRVAWICQDGMTPKASITFYVPAGSTYSFSGSGDTDVWLVERWTETYTTTPDPGYKLLSPINGTTNLDLVNTSQYPIYPVIMVGRASNSGTQSITDDLIISGVVVSQVSNIQAPLSGIVPAGATYRVDYRTRDQTALWQWLDYRVP